MLKKLIKLLSSLRVTIWLIGLLSLVFALGLWIPQKRLLKEWYFQWKAHSPTLVSFLDALQLTDIYTSPITLTIWLLFFVTLSLVMWQRIPLIKKRIQFSEAKIVDPETASGYSFRARYRLPDGMSSATLLALLRKHGFTIFERNGLFYGIKNRFSPIAFGLFHLSFYLILIGGIVSLYTEFYGYLELMEGDTFQGELDRYNAVPDPPSLPKFGSPPQVSFTVKKIVPLVSGFTETGLKVTLADSRGKEHVLDINKPYIADSATFVLKNLGMAPLLVLSDTATGKELDGAYVRLDCQKGRIDHFDMGGYHFLVKFYPDFMRVDGKPATRTLEFNNPTFLIQIEKDKKLIAEKLLPRGGAIDFDGKRLSMRQMPFWVRFVVMKEHGIPILYTGFFLVSLAVVWRFIWYRREIAGKVCDEGGERTLVVAARSEFYKKLAEDEFTKLFTKLLAQRGSKST